MELAPQPVVHERGGITILPPFMRPAKQKPVYTVAETLSPTPHYHILEAPDAGIFSSIGAVDNHIHKVLNGSVRYEPDLLPRAGDPDNPLQGFGHLWENAKLSNPQASGSGYYMFSSDDLATQVLGWEANYLNFLDIAERYLLLPNEFILAYQFLETHPAFYHRTHADGDHWEQNNGLAGIWQDVFAGEAAHTARFSFEHGPYDDDHKVQSTHDHYIDAWGDSYEEAIIALASNVHHHYDLLGMNRGRPIR